jgi:hypothetical protein
MFNTFGDLWNLILEYFYALTAKYPSLLTVSEKVIGIIIAIAIPFSIMILIGIIYSVERLKAIRKKESDIYNARPAAEDKQSSISPEAKKFTDKWSKILTHVESPNGNDWMLAIIEADIILGEMLEKMGYQGDSIGEKLKRVEKADFQTLDQAWEAHKVRNAIAHQGSDFVLNQREAKRVISLYREVFEEFYYI